MAQRHAPHVRHDAPRMKGERSRNDDGQLRQKRGDTHAGTIEEMYNVDLAVRRDKHLENVLREGGFDSLNDLLERKR